jgi:hypothetical protein
MYTIANLIHCAAKLVALNRPAESDFNSVDNYIWNTAPVRSLESAFIKCKEDLITLRPGREHAWLDSVVESIIKWVHRRCGLSEVCFKSYSLCPY